MQKAQLVMSHSPSRLRLFCFCALAASFLSLPAAAQSNLASTVDRLGEKAEAMESRLQTLEKRNINEPVAAIRVEIDALREEMSSMRGRIEQVEYASRQQEQTLRRLEADVDARLALLEQNAAASAMPPVIGDDAGGAPVIDDPDPFEAPVIADEPEETVPEETPAPVQEEAKDVVLDQAGDLTQQSGALAPAAYNNPREQYNAAFTALNQGNYEEAETLFRDFTRRYPDSSLIGNAWYWLGESFYARSRYDDAIVQFRQGFQIMPKGPKAPDNLLKLGMALSRTNQPAEACTVFKELLANYGHQSQAVKRTATKESAKLNCQ
jgi:tol-pal system protein YbgF